MDAAKLINSEIEFTNERCKNAPFVITKLECKILMESYHTQKSKEDAHAAKVLSWLEAYATQSNEPEGGVGFFICEDGRIYKNGKLIPMYESFANTPLSPEESAKFKKIVNQYLNPEFSKPTELPSEGEIEEMVLKVYEGEMCDYEDESGDYYRGNTVQIMLKTLAELINKD